MAWHVMMTPYHGTLFNPLTALKGFMVLTALRLIHRPYPLLLFVRLTKQVTAEDAVKEYKRHYEELLTAEKERHKQELRRTNADKRKIQDDVVAIILDQRKRKKLLRQLPVHQLPVSSMLQSLLLNAGYDTLDDVISRPLQQLSHNVATNRYIPKNCESSSGMSDWRIRVKLIDRKY